MHNFLLAAWGLGIVTLLIGIAGFLDTRKVDRRFKNGYKNNETDTRDFRVAAKRTFIGAIICLVAFGIGKLTPDIPNEESAPVEVASPPAVSPPPAVESAQETPTASPPSDPLRTDSPPTEQVATLVQPEVENTSKVSKLHSQEIVVHLTRDLCTFDGTYFGNIGCSHDNVKQGYLRVYNDYQDAQSRIGGADVGFRIEQESWFNETQKSCSTDECLLGRFNLRSSDINSRYRSNG